MDWSTAPRCGCGVAELVREERRRLRHRSRSSCWNPVLESRVGIPCWNPVLESLGWCVESQVTL